jgi:antitoxin HicB
MKTKDFRYYQQLPYTTILKRDSSGAFLARLEELPGCSAHGTSAEEALGHLAGAFSVWIRDAIEAGDPIPEPHSNDLPSGKWLQRVPRRLHQKLVRRAAQEDVSLNQLVTSILAEAVGRASVHYVDYLPAPSASLHFHSKGWEGSFSQPKSQWKVLDFGCSVSLEHLAIFQNRVPDQLQLTGETSDRERTKNQRERFWHGLPGIS